MTCVCVCSYVYSCACVPPFKFFLDTGELANFEYWFQVVHTGVFIFYVKRVESLKMLHLVCHLVVLYL